MLGPIFEMLQESKPAACGELRGHPAARMISPMPRLVLLPRGVRLQRDERLGVTQGK